MIRRIHASRFRSIASAGLADCGGLNILIGKNNVGKSNILAALALVLTHLKSRQLVGPWPTKRVQEEFLDRDDSRPIRIGFELDLSPEMRDGICERLLVEAPHLERSIEQIKNHETLTIIIAGIHDRRAVGAPFLFVQQMTVGSLVKTDEDITVDGIRLLSVPNTVGVELFQRYQTLRQAAADMETLGELREGRGAFRHGPPIEFLIQQPKEMRGRAVRDLYGLPSTTREAVFNLVSTVDSFEEFRRAVGDLIDEKKRRMEDEAKKETAGTLSTFAGEARRVPSYIDWILSELGSVPFLQLQERKQPIGRDEAETLLRLKVTRGGPERLQTVQNTIKTLLGVRLDAFEAEGEPSRRGERGAEIDVDNFLVEANGAGIREALRIVLDLELKRPSLVLIEEPEVHLHPGLARVVAGYLRAKSEEMQIFVTTHSSELVESVWLKNLFLVSRDANGRTVCDQVEGEEAVLRIPGELGLRPSSLFMYDVLVFVEGVSDEAILRAFAAKLGLDFNRHNVGFVWMQGIRNFAAFAAESTLAYLTRRKTRMWFVVDRDEREDDEISRMLQLLGDRAKLHVLQRREVENYLLDARALKRWMEIRMAKAGRSESAPDEPRLKEVIADETEALKAEVVRLRVERRLLRPVFLHVRNRPGLVEERLEAGIRELDERRKAIENYRRQVEGEVNREWANRALDYVPGTALLKAVARTFGVAFSKERDDAEALAECFEASWVPNEICGLLTDIARS